VPGAALPLHDRPLQQVEEIGLHEAILAVPGALMAARKRKKSRFGLPATTHKANALVYYKNAETYAEHAKHFAERGDCKTAVRRYGVALKFLGMADAHDGSARRTSNDLAARREDVLDRLDDAQRRLDKRCMR